MINLITFKFLLILFIVSTNSCISEQDFDRSIIKFQDSTKTVELRLTTMNSLMARLKPAKNESHNFFIDYTNNIFINSKNLGKIGNLQFRSDSALQSLTQTEKTELINEIKFLTRNYITAVYLDKSCNCYLYDYRVLDDPSSKTDRIIYLDESGKDYETLLVGRKQLDKVGRLVLIGYH